MVASIFENRDNAKGFLVAFLVPPYVIATTIIKGLFIECTKRFVTQGSVPRFFNTTGKMSVEPDPQAMGKRDSKPLHEPGQCCKSLGGDSEAF